tara:strand:+ start:277 stop:1503 length:1227 start_codon:yes stop_codon:yes gene_type:complete
MQRYGLNMSQIQEQMVFEEYIDGVLQLDDEQFYEYYDSLDEDQQQELEEVIGKIAKGIGKIAVAPITLPFKAVKGIAKGVGKVAKGAAKAVTSKPAKAAGSMAAKGAAAAGKAAVGGVKKLAKRLSTTGRADAAAKKANAIAKRTAERERLAKEKERVAKERERAKKSGRADQRSAVADKQKELDKAAQKTRDTQKKEIEKEALDKEDEPAVKDLIKNLRKGSKTHSKQADDLEKDLKDEFIPEELEPLEEFTSKQIDRLKKEYESLRGKETGVNPEKFAKLRKLMDRFTKSQLLQLVKADIPILTSGAKSKLVLKFGMKWKQLPEDFLPYIEIFADDEKELSEAKRKSNFKEVDPKVVDRIEKMMNGTRAEKDSIANMLNYFMPPEVVDMVRYKLKIVPKRGRIKFR